MPVKLFSKYSGIPEFTYKFPFPRAIVWTCRVYPFHGQWTRKVLYISLCQCAECIRLRRQQCGREDVPLSTPRSVNEQGVSLSIGSSVNVQGVSLSTVDLLCHAGVSLSMASSVVFRAVFIPLHFCKDCGHPLFLAGNKVVAIFSSFATRFF